MRFSVFISVVSSGMNSSSNSPDVEWISYPSWDGFIFIVTVFCCSLAHAQQIMNGIVVRRMILIYMMTTLFFL